jgi:hypothetical protein
VQQYQDAVELVTVIPVANLLNTFLPFVVVVVVVVVPSSS